MQSALSFCVFCFCFCFVLFSFLFWESWLAKLEQSKNYLLLLFWFSISRFQFKSNQEAYEKLNIFRSVWVERKVILDEINPKIHRNFEIWVWLPLLDVEHPPPATLIREFYWNLSIHINDSNIHFVKTWIRSEEFFITPEVLASTLNVPLLQ